MKKKGCKKVTWGVLHYYNSTRWLGAYYPGPDLEDNMANISQCSDTDEMGIWMKPQNRLIIQIRVLKMAKWVLFYYTF